MFFKAAILRKLFDIRFSYKHGNFSHVCLLMKMASKTVTRSIWPAKTAVSPRSSIRFWGRFPQGTSATQRQKFHTDDINQCLHNNSHGDPNANMFNFTFLLVDFGKMLCSSANELQQNSNASSRETIFLKYWLFC